MATKKTSYWSPTRRKKNETHKRSKSLDSSSVKFSLSPRKRLVKMLSLSPRKRKPPTSLATNETETTHLIVLQHGLHGDESDWGYFKQVLDVSFPDKVLVHISTCNSKTRFSTHDGIDAGGQRLAEEILQLVQTNPCLRHFSIIGHSLGGLYARYAVGVLFAEGFFDRVEPMNFITLASPHLGIRRPQRGTFNLVYNAISPLLFSRTGSQFTLTDAKDVSDRTLVLAGLVDQTDMEGLNLDRIQLDVSEEFFANVQEFQELPEIERESIKRVFELMTRDPTFHKQAFSGKDCVDWMIGHHIATSRAHAIQLSSYLLLSSRMWWDQIDWQTKWSFSDSDSTMYVLKQSDWEMNDLVAAAEASVHCQDFSGWLGCRLGPLETDFRSWFCVLRPDTKTMQLFESIESHVPEQILQIQGADGSMQLDDGEGYASVLLKKNDQFLLQLRFQATESTGLYPWLVGLLAAGVCVTTVSSQEARTDASPPLLYCMTRGAFLEGLTKFKCRTLYSNVFFDFQVPYTSSAMRSHNPYRGDPTGCPTSSVYQHITLHSLMTANVSVLRDAKYQAQVELLRDEKLSEEKRMLLRMILESHGSATSKSTSPLRKTKQISSTAPRTRNTTSAGNKSAPQIHQVEEGHFVVDNLSQAFCTDPDCDTLRSMLMALQSLSWRRFDVIFDGILAHERIIGKRANLYSPCDTGLDVVCHIVDTILLA